MVEARGVEPLSKSIAAQPSPSAVSNLDFAFRPPTDKLLVYYPEKVSLSALREADSQVSHISDALDPRHGRAREGRKQWLSC